MARFSPRVASSLTGCAAWPCSRPTGTEDPASGGAAGGAARNSGARRGSDRTVQRSSGDSLPTLAPPSLAGSAGEPVDAGALAFLTRAALVAQEEEEARRQWLERNRSVVLFSGRSRLSVEGEQAASGTGVAELVRHGCGEVRFLFWDASKEETLCQCRVERNPLDVFRSRRLVRWHALEFTDDDPVAVHLALLFASEDLLVQFKDAYEAVQSAMPGG